MTAVSGQRVLIYGGRGALGSVCVHHFKSKGWWVGTIDIAANDEADANVLAKLCESFCEHAEQPCIDFQCAMSSFIICAIVSAIDIICTLIMSLDEGHTKVTSDVAKLLGDQKVDAIICVAGGWAGGNCDSKDIFKSSDLMWKQSVWTSTISSYLASQHLKPGGLLTLTGAKASLTATPGMMGYGMAKAAVHQLCESLAGENSGLPAGAVAVAILPVILDTPMNRKFMSNADFSSWTPLEYVSELFFSWATGSGRPASGSLIQLVTSGGKTEATPVH